MSFVERQEELRRHLLWGPSRGKKRRQRLDELRALVRDELRREVTTPAPEQAYARPARRFHWLDQDDENG